MACYMCDIARHCMHSAASMSRHSITFYGILGHITPWAGIASHIMVCFSMKVHDMVWFSLAVQRGVACCSGWLYDESWVCGLDLMLAYAMSLLHVIDSVSSFSYVLVCLGGWVYG